MKWFPNAIDASEDLRRESPLSPTQWPLPEKPKKSSHTRLSATFTESRPWNFISSSQASDRSSSSSRKRRSLFGGRSSIMSSNANVSEIFPSGFAPPEGDPATHTVGRRGPVQGGSRPPSIAGSVPRTSESWRPSMFSRKRSSRLGSAEEPVAEPQVSRFGNKRPSMDFWSRDSDTESACESTQLSPAGSRHGMLTSQVYHKLKKDSISQPFNFQHVTHTQKDHLPAMESVTDRELVSEFWAASLHQAPRSQLHGIPVRRIEYEHPERRVRTPQAASDSPRSENFQFRHGPLAGMSANFMDQQGSAPGTPSDVDSITPINEGRRSLSQEGRSRNFTLHGLSSAERLSSRGADQREPPAMLHPAFRNQGSAPLPSPSYSIGPVYELPAMSLDSVPEELEANSPPRSNTRDRFPVESSPSTPPRSYHHTPSPVAFAKIAAPLPFPTGNAFSQALGTGADTSSHHDFSCEESVASLTSGETWENEVDLLYLVEAESTCDFDWTSLKSGRKGSDESQHRRDSATTSSLRTPSVHDDAASRPSSRRASTKSYQDENIFSGFDGASPFSTVLTQKMAAGSKRHSAMSNSNAELSPIPEMSREVATSSKNSSSGNTNASPTAKYRRSASYSGQRPARPKAPARWSIASPLYLPADVKDRTPSFTKKLTASLAEQMLFSAPLFPPPAMPLPSVPKPLPSLPTGPVSPPISPPTLCTPEFSSLRRPSTSQDRALLQAAGRIVQRGRSARPATPSRLSHVQNVQSGLSGSPRLTGQQRPFTPPKMEAVQFKLSLFPTPPSSPPRPQQEEAYPAWI